MSCHLRTMLFPISGAFYPAVSRSFSCSRDNNSFWFYYKWRLRLRAAFSFILYVVRLALRGLDDLRNSNFRVKNEFDTSPLRLMSILLIFSKTTISIKIRWNLCFFVSMVKVHRVYKIQIIYWSVPHNYTLGIYITFRALKNPIFSYLALFEYVERYTLQNLVVMPMKVESSLPYTSCFFDRLYTFFAITKRAGTCTRLWTTARLSTQHCSGLQQWLMWFIANI